MLGTKKRETPNTIRRLEDHPRWAEAVETQRRLQREQERIDEDDRKAQGLAGQSSQQNRIDHAAAAILAKAEGRPEPVAQPDTRQATAEQREAIKAAIERHATAMQRLRNELSSVIYGAWADEHLAARRRIAVAAVELKKAWDAERELAYKIHAAGGLESALYGNRLLCNFANVSKLPQVLQTMQLGAFQQANANLLKD